MDQVPIKKELVDLASTVKSENLKSDFSVALRYICLPCGTKDGVQNSSGAKAYKYTTTKFPLLTQHYKDYHANSDFQYCRTLRVTCLVCNLRLSLKKFREHVQATHPNCLASIICVHICLLCNDHCNYREKMLSHLLETHSKKEADNFDTNVISRKLCLFCGANGNLGDPQMEDHQCTSIVVDDVAQFIDLTEAGSPPADDLMCEPLVTEPAATERGTENCENSPANHQSQPIADLQVPPAAETEADVSETVVEEQPFVPPSSRPKKRSLGDSDSASVLSRSCSEDELGRKKKSKKYNYKCGEKNCFFAHDDMEAMAEHLDSHLQKLKSCESCQLKHRGPIDAQIHRFLFEKHAEKSVTSMLERVVKEKKKKQADIMCNLEFDGAGYGSYSYSTLISTTNEFTPFVDMSLKNAYVGPIEWRNKVCQNRAWNKPKNSDKE